MRGTPGTALQLDGGLGLAELLTYIASALVILVLITFIVGPPMSLRAEKLDSHFLDLLGQAGISFTGTVRRTTAATVADVPVDGRTVVVYVDQLVNAPDPLTGLAGTEITVQLAPDAELLHPGDQATFFTNVTAVGQSIVVAEVGRLPVSAVEPSITAALRAGQAPHASFAQMVEQERLRSHAMGADAVIVGRVVRLEKAGAERFFEHDPDWWRATLAVLHVERGEVPPGEVNVLYANSLDVRWYKCPKPKAGQEGMWLLHATVSPLRELAVYAILHPEDYQPAINLNLIRE
jgi:hypothetical protein